MLRRLLTGAAVIAALLAGPGSAAAQAKRELIIAEPVHGTGYLPMYVAAAKGFFEQEGIAIKVLTIETGSGHTNAVLSGQAFAFIGGPEHNAFAKAKGAELRAVVNVVDRGNVYYVAAKGKEPAGTDWPAYVKGKTIAVGFFGGTPNSITRYLLAKWGLDNRRDVTMTETTTAAILTALKTGQAQIGVVTEPILTQGIRQGIWGEPFFNVPVELGPYAFSTMNVRLESIEKEPKVVEAFVRAMVKGLKATYADPEEAAQIARKEFPTMALEDLKATLARSFADKLWSPDGMIAAEAWNTGHAVVREAGILKSDVAFDQIIDMRFVRSALAAVQ